MQISFEEMLLKSRKREGQYYIALPDRNPTYILLGG